MALLPQQEHLRLYAPLDGKFEDKLSETRRAWGYPASPADSSGAGYTLTANGSPASRKSPEAKFGWGYDLDGVDDFLKQTSSAFKIIGDLSIAAAVEFDAASGADERITNCEGLDETEAANDCYNLIRLADGNIRLEWEYGAGIGEILVSTGSPMTAAGFYTITATRDTATKTAVVKVNGVEVINTTYANNPTGGANSSLGIGTNGLNESEFMDGAIYEVRIWDQLIDQAILDRIVDPDDSSYTGKPEGNELALWYMGTQPAAVTGSLVGANTLADKSGNGYTLTTNGAPAFRSAEDPKWGGGYDFDGTDDSIASNAAGLENTGDLSLTASFTVDASGVIIARGRAGLTGASGTSYYIDYVSGTSKIRWQQVYSDNTSDTISSTNAITIGAPHVITARRNDTAKTVVVYIDGVEEINFSYAGKTIKASVDRFAIGARRNEADTDTETRLDGGIYEVRIWDSLVEQSLLDDIANGDYVGRALGNELAYWDFATAPIPVASPQGGALSFNGTDGYIKVDSLSSIAPGDTWTIGSWFTADAPATGTNTIAGLGDTVDADTEIRLFVTGSNLDASIIGDAATAATLSGTTTLTAGQNYHACLTNDGTTYRLYLNALEEATSATDVGAITPDTASLGAFRDSTVTGYFAGDLSQAVFYDTALTAGEIKALMAATSQG